MGNGQFVVKSENGGKSYADKTTTDHHTIAGIITSNIEKITLKTDKTTPVIEKTTPVIEKTMMKIEKTTPKIEKITPIIEKTTPEIEKITPAKEKTPPFIEKMTPGIEKIIPKVEKITPTIQKTSSKVRNTPVIEKTTSDRETTPAIEKSTPEVKKTTGLKSLKEVIAVLFFLSVFLVVGPAALIILFYVPFVTGNWYLTLIYCIYWLWDLRICAKGGRPDWYVYSMRNWSIWSYFISYFPIKLIKTADIPPNKNYIFCSHPHGVLCFGIFGAMGTEGAGFSALFPGIRPRLLSLEGNFWMPAFRELFMGSGACASSKKSLKHLLSSTRVGTAPVLVVGGVPEIANFYKDKVVLVIKKRKGFIKLALEHGADLVPCFSFGETDLFSQFTHLNSAIQDRLTKFIGFSPVFFTGRGFKQNQFGILPHRREINVVVGKPIRVNKIVEPTVLDVECLQNEYIASMLQLYQDHKEEYGYGDKELVIV
ncbi:diacylglycerol O-acyltransferase 2 isoform X3 [Eurytemora carolleeae]|uniref:diacylglycerol O-acyltransferase 2 isoform X3 n=1 Tax=Eurytemora carolleeae TaxID=1294199 RepID=UPI000C769AB7|nr:diacylglycerol O-acyltransferase 2 isoform X3 [Eurytemora carolleeae]|eukprot:XP_023339516.1 diacylglycerol O-acyltransferase 2-like isoform X3 [Eurytemora affinis]